MIDAGCLNDDSGSFILGFDMYGLHINGKPPFEGIAMLVEVIRTPLGSGGEYRYPILNHEQSKEYHHIATMIWTDASYGKAIWSDGQNGDLRDLVVGKINADGVSWATLHKISNLSLQYNLAAFLIWRIKNG